MAPHIPRNIIYKSKAFAKVQLLEAQLAKANLDLMENEHSDADNDACTDDELPIPMRLGDSNSNLPPHRHRSTSPTLSNGSASSTWAAWVRCVTYNIRSIISNSFPFGCCVCMYVHAVRAFFVYFCLARAHACVSTSSFLQTARCNRAQNYTIIIIINCIYTTACIQIVSPCTYHY